MVRDSESVPPYMSCEDTASIRLPKATPPFLSSGDHRSESSEDLGEHMPPSEDTINGNQEECSRNGFISPSLIPSNRPSTACRPQLKLVSCDTGLDSQENPLKAVPVNRDIQPTRPAALYVMNIEGGAQGLAPDRDLRMQK